MTRFVTACTVTGELPYVPNEVLLVDLEPDERRFLVDLVTDRLTGSVTELLEGRFGPPTPEPSEPADSGAPVVALAEARLRRRPLAR